MKRRRPDRLASSAFGIERGRSGHPRLDDDQWELFQEHFALFPWDALPQDPIGLDLGCGDGLWASLVGQRTGHLHCFESDTNEYQKAQTSLGEGEGHTLYNQPIDEGHLAEDSLDFCYAIGSLAEVDNLESTLRCWVRALKPGAPMLVYLCYALDNRPAWFRALFQAASLLRRVVTAQPQPLRGMLTDAIALSTYFPLSRTAAAMSRLGLPTDVVPFSLYRSASIKAMREAASERFATSPERRFTAEEIRVAMNSAGLSRVTVSSETPYWTVVGFCP